MDGMGSCGVCAFPITAVEAEARSLVGLLRHRKFSLKVLLFRSDCDRVDHIGVIILAVDLCAPDERSFDIAACVKGNSVGTSSGQLKSVIVKLYTVVNSACIADI